MAEAQAAEVALQSANHELEDEQYARNMVLGQRAWFDGNVRRTLQLLVDCRPELRHWEWDYVKAMCHTDLRTIRAHTGAVNSMCFSPDGRLMASESTGGIVQIWEVVNGELRPIKPLTVYSGEAGEIYSLAFSPDGKRLVAGTGAISTPKTTGKVKVWETNTWQLIGEPHVGSMLVYSVDFSPDGKLLATGGYDRVVRLWDAETLTLRDSFPEHAQAVMSVAFHRNSEVLASADGGNDYTETNKKDSVIRLWDLKTREFRELKGHEGQLICMAWSPVDELLASAGWDSTIRIWNTTTAEQPSILRGHTGLIRGLKFSADGHQLFSGSEDASVRIWNVRAGREVQMLRGHTSAVQSLTVDPVSNHPVSGGWNGEIKVWDPERSRECITLPGNDSQMQDVAFSKDGRWLAAANGDKTVFVWDRKNLNKPPLALIHTWQVWSVSFHPDGQHLVSGAGDQNGLPGSVPGELTIWDLVDSTKRSLSGHEDWIESVAYSPDGKLIASGSGDTTVRIWNAVTGQNVHFLRGHTTDVYCVAFSRDGRLLASGSVEGALKIWDVAQGTCAATLIDPKGSMGLVIDVAFSPDGRHIAAACQDDVARIWDLDSQQLVSVLAGHATFPQAVAFSPDGQRLATCSVDKTVKIWNPATGQELLTLKGHDGMVFDVVFSPNGQIIASASDDGTVKLWEAPPWKDPPQAIER